MFELNGFHVLTEIDNLDIQYVSVFARKNQKWLICHERESGYWTCPGGKIEHGETPIQAASRELWEETGSVAVALTPLFIYCIKSDYGLSYGVQYFTLVESVSVLPKFEMDQIDFVIELPLDNFEYPMVHSSLEKEITKLLERGVIL
jgi:8-oxo-dGTP diphosphatase